MFLFHFILLKNSCCMQPTPLCSCPTNESQPAVCKNPVLRSEVLDGLGLKMAFESGFSSAMIAWVENMEANLFFLWELLMLNGGISCCLSEQPLTCWGWGGLLCRPSQLCCRKEFKGWLWAGGLRRCRHSVCLEAGSSSFCASRSLCCAVECVWFCQAFILKVKERLLKITYFWLETSQGRE